MFNSKDQQQQILQLLGERLKKARLERNETQQTFAARIGLSRQSLAKMENGAGGTIPLADWLAASAILDRLDGWQSVLTGQQDLFAQYAIQEKSRKRAGGRRGSSPKGEQDQCVNSTSG